LRPFIEATAWHGTLERAEAILSSHPEVATSDIHAAAILVTVVRLKADTTYW
jgi:hypothetical protein